MEDRLPRKLAAILYADVAGYSRLTGEDEDATHRKLTEYLDLISSTIESHRGRVMHYAGDAVLAKFDAVVDAMAAAIAIQRSLEVRNRELPGKRKVEFRIGVNSGDVIEDRGDIYGDGVNVAARLENLAKPGGICISDAVRTAVGKRIDFEYEDIGEQEVKNILEPVRAYRVSVVQDGGAASPEGRKPEIPDKPSIAVLPFTNMSGDPEQDYFCDGITEDIITALSRISDIFVIARNSSLIYKDKPKRVVDVANELGVRYVLEGSVQKAGNRVRVTSQLIDASAEHHLWAERYDRDLANIFAIQDEITHEVTVALQVNLLAGDVARQWSAGTRNREAWELLIAGRKHYYRFGAEGVAEARRHFEQALLLDPEYGTAISWLGWTHWYDARFGPASGMQSSLELAERQIARLESFENRHSLIGTLQAAILLLKGQHEEAIRSARAAVEVAHGTGDRAQLGMILMFAGRPAEAIEEITQAIRLVPHHTNWVLYPLALAYFWHGDVESAINVCTDYVGKEPGDVFGRASLAVMLSAAGRNEDSKNVVKDLLAKFPTFSVEEYARPQLYKDPKCIEQLTHALRELGVPEQH